MTDDKLATDGTLRRPRRPTPTTPVGSHAPEEAHSSNRSGFWMAALCLLMVGAVLFTLLDHPLSHWTERWPLLLVLLCPLLHFLMHRGHGGH